MIGLTKRQHDLLRFDLPPRKWTGLSRSAFGLGGADIAQ